MPSSDLVSHLHPEYPTRPQPVLAPGADVTSRALAQLKAWARIHRPRAAWQQARAFAPAAAFPHFSYPDSNFWIWMFGWHYRNLLDEWKRRASAAPAASVFQKPRTRGLPSRGSSISQVAIGAYYLAVRRALLVSVLLRGIGAMSAVVGAGWLLLSRLARRRQSLPGWSLDYLLGSG